MFFKKFLKYIYFTVESADSEPGESKEFTQIWPIPQNYVLKIRGMMDQWIPESARIPWKYIRNDKIRTFYYYNSQNSKT